MKQLMLGAPLILLLLCQVALAQRFELKQSPITNKADRTNPNSSFVNIKKALNKAIAVGDDQATALCYGKIGELFYEQAAYSQALTNFYKADVLYRKGNRPDLLAGNLNQIGKTYFYNRQYPTALKTFQQALASYQKIDNVRGVAESYGYIGQSYEKTGRHEQAFAYQLLALREFKNTGDKIGIAKIYENLGSVYEDRLKLDSALKYFTLALNLNISADAKMAQIEVVNNIGDVYRKTKRYPQAMAYSRRSVALAKGLDAQYHLASAYRDLSKTFYLIGNADSAYHYSEAGREIFMEIFSQDTKKQLLLLQTLFETEQKDNAILSLKKDKKFNAFFTIGAITISLLVVSLGASIISRQRLKIRNEQKLNEQNNAIFEVQKKAMEADLELKSKELTSHTLNLIQKNQLLEELKSRLGEMIKDDKRDQRKELKQVIGLITFNSNQEKNWNDFRIVFERVHENFFESLKKYSTSLTASELRLVALLKMNLSSPDISTMLGISQDSLRISRYRLRKKLKLEEGDSLAAFLQRL
ncbi:tetratricopeptide repeat protein [Pedobacter frigiditerrae]|uniref:Tetratricopeptide repeat protein n=1 Tax=Pedobacter frigiditerrae TaxID=2530452 RepID=A0A4R0MKD0_9SPHI|nr:tetratricopeptide repeat protein [Pedobacter frigiditerrae]TCC87078.1 tetratricopeptide repeat protein [Pedobacter frigiditerrae]